MSKTAAGPTIALRNGTKMPTVGLGLWKVSQNVAANQVYEAIKAGYRLLDGACDYGNEVEVGQGIKRAIDEGIIKRSDLFVTSKLWCTYHRQEHVKPALKRTLKDLGLDYVDLYLIHFPIPLKFVPFEERYPPMFRANDGDEVQYDNVPYQETYQAMEKLYNEGLAKNIGVSNIPGAMIYDVFTYARVKPAVLQIEMHPYLARLELVDLALSKGMAVTAYSSFGDTSYHEIRSEDGFKYQPLLSHDVVTKIATKHGKSAGQVLLRWAAQRGCAVIPKTSNPKRLKENLDIFGFSLASEEVKEISDLDRNYRINDPADYIKHPIWAA